MRAFVHLLFTISTSLFRSDSYFIFMLYGYITTLERSYSVEGARSQEFLYFCWVESSFYNGLSILIS